MDAAMFVFGAFFGAAIGISSMAIMITAKQADLRAEIIHGEKEVKSAQHQSGPGQARD